MIKPLKLQGFDIKVGDAPRGPLERNVIDALGLHQPQQQQQQEEM